METRDETGDDRRDPATEQTAAGLGTTRGIATSLTFTDAEKERLRDLAKWVAELAARPGEEEKARRWMRHNDLENGQPLIFCDPENGWNEIVPLSRLLCLDPLARFWEMHFLMEIFWGTQMLDDRVIEAAFDVPYYYEDTGWGLHERRIGGSGGGSYTWEAPLKD